MALMKRTFRVARIEDAPAVSEFSKYVFEQLGGYGVSSEIFVEWFRVPYLEISHLLVEDGEIIGYYTILPFKHEQTTQVMQKEIKPSKIPVNELPRLEPGMPIDLFIGDVAVDPKRKNAVVYLLMKLFEYFENLGKQGVEVEGIYATASTRSGINTCRRVGMTQMDVPDVLPDWIPFELKIQETKNRYTKDYIRALNIYKRKNELR